MITGVILARNEEHNIVECLLALRPHVEEIILIDMESADRTVELAHPFVAKVLAHPLVSQFDAARNIAIPEATFDWLWFVDADERIPQATGQMARGIVATRGSELEAVSIPFKSYFCGKWIEHCGWWPGYTMARLVKRGHFRFSERLHGGIEIDGRTLQVPPDPTIGIDHFSYSSLSHYLEKANRYTTAEAENLAKLGATWDWVQATREMTRELWNYYERNQGYLDGEHGWLLSWLSGQYRWLSRAKILDVTGFDQSAGRPTSIPESIDAVLEVMERELAEVRATNPKLPLDIVLRTPIWDPSGYADEGRTIAKALAVGNRRLSVEEIAWSDAPCQLPPMDMALLRALSSAKRSRFSVTITNCIATLVEPDARASLNVLRTASETDRVPKAWQAQLEKFDEIWVLSHHSAEAFRRSGVAPEKIRVVPSCLDTDLFVPDGERLELPDPLRDCFVFLSVFDWQYRKGWDVLLNAYCQQFQPEGRTGLLLKISRAHGHTLEKVRSQMDEHLSRIGQDLVSRTDIVIWDQALSSSEMAALYRSVDAFVLASRGEGWGRPYMEAMASGLPTIGTGASGNVDFMDENNSILVPATLVDVSEEAAREIPVFSGQRWFEPDIGGVRDAMRRVYEDSDLRTRIGARARIDIVANYSLARTQNRMDEAISDAESRFVMPQWPTVSESQIAVELEGEFFAQHSFSIVNEQIALELLKRDSLAFAARQVVHLPTSDELSARNNLIRAALRRDLGQGDKVVIRHKYPPNWEPVAKPATWVHIQPWEFGYLPEAWLQPLREHVDEIWAPSKYVRDVYLRSGIPSDKLFVIPWGIDPRTFCPSVPALLVETEKSFRFLFVGGTIPRKGFDLLLAAYLMEFGPDEDVCLVVKDMGSQSFYQGASHAREILMARDDKRNPEIVYFDGQLSEGQLASLYAACDCLVAPYRGEGFGLPILEAMACGLTPIIPRGGPSDDYASATDALFMPAEIAKCEHPWELCGPPTEFRIAVRTIAETMRFAFENRDTIHSMGAAGSERVRRDFTWESTARRMEERIKALAERHARKRPRRVQPLAGLPTALTPSISEDPTISACIVVRDSGLLLPDCLARVAPYVNELFVIVDDPEMRAVQIAKEYGGHVIDASKCGVEAAQAKVASIAKCKWLLNLQSSELLTETSGSSISKVLTMIPNHVNHLRCEVRTKTGESSWNSDRQIRLVRIRGGIQTESPVRASNGDSANGVLDVDIMAVKC